VLDERFELGARPLGPLVVTHGLSILHVLLQVSDLLPVRLPSCSVNRIAETPFSTASVIAS
jgi:hypothetical protein